MIMEDLEYRSRLAVSMHNRLRLSSKSKVLKKVLENYYKNIVAAHDKDVYDLTLKQIDDIAKDLLYSFHFENSVRISNEVYRMNCIEKFAYKKYVKVTNDWLNELEDILEDL